MSSWQKISSKIILNHPRLQVVEDLVSLPSGQETDYLRFEPNHPSVVVLAENEYGQIGFVNDYYYPLDVTLLSLPGGGGEANETPKQSAKREMKEELGLVAKSIDQIGFFHLSPRRRSMVMHVFHAKGLAEVGLDRDEEEVDMEIEWIHKNDVRGLILENKITNIDTLAAWSFYRERFLAP